MIRLLDNTPVELDGWDLDKSFMYGHGSDLFVAFGCSWTRAWNAVPQKLSFTDPRFKDDVDFLSSKSYTALLSKHLGIGAQINFAIPGSNNDTQSRLIIEFVEKNRHKFNKVFLLWGITSVYRWELFCNRIDAPWSYMDGQDFHKDSDRELKYFLQHHFDQGWQLARLADKILTTSAYLSANQVEHMFFPVFQSYNQHNMTLNTLPEKVMFGKNLYNNDMLSLMCEAEQFDAVNNFSADTIVTDGRIDRLVDAGYLNSIDRHPTEKGHAFIANKLIKYYNSVTK